MFRFLPLMVKNSLRNRRRSLLTVASIAISLCLLGVLMAMYRALFLGNEQTPAQALRLITHHKVGLAQEMPVSYRDKIRRIPGVRNAMVWQWFGGTYKDARNQKNFFARFSVEPDKFFDIMSEDEMPEEQKKAFQTSRTACIASEALARKFGWTPGEKIMLQGDIFPVNLDLTLVGTFKEPQNAEVLYYSDTYLREALKPGRRADNAGAFQVQVETPADVPRVSKAIDAMFDNSPAPTKTESERNFQLSFVSFLGNLRLFLAAIFGAVTFTVLLVSANTISMSVRERIREVGVLKTLGYTKEQILGIVLGEAAVISLTGGVLGLGLANLMCWGVRQGPDYIQALKLMSLTPVISLLALGLALLIGLVSSFVPAWNASRTSILDSLRYSG